MIEDVIDAAAQLGPADAAGKPEGEKTAHHKVEMLSTKDAAVVMLNTNMSKLETALGASHFGTVHEATYSLESSVARIAQEPGYDGLQVTVAPRIEKVHLASEWWTPRR